MEKLVPDHFRPDVAECREMAEEMAAAAREEGIALVSCAHDSLTSDTIGKARCIDPRILSAVVNSQERKLAVSAIKAAPTRKDCGCVASVDIGRLRHLLSRLCILLCEHESGTGGAIIWP